MANNMQCQSPTTCESPFKNKGGLVNITVFLGEKADRHGVFSMHPSSKLVSLATEIETRFKIDGDVDLFAANGMELDDYQHSLLENRLAPNDCFVVARVMNDSSTVDVKETCEIARDLFFRKSVEVAPVPATRLLGPRAQSEPCFGLDREGMPSVDFPTESVRREPVYGLTGQSYDLNSADDHGVIYCSLKTASNSTEVYGPCHLDDASNEGCSLNTGSGFSECCGVYNNPPHAVGPVFSTGPNFDAHTLTYPATQLVPPKAPGCVLVPMAAQFCFVPPSMPLPPPPIVFMSPPWPLEIGMDKMSSRTQGNHHLVYQAPSGAWNHLVFWKADARNLIKKNKQMLSGEFSLPLGEEGTRVLFTLMMKPKQVFLAKGGGSMVKGKTSCTIDLSCKCEKWLQEEISTLEFCLSVGSKNPTKLQPQRGPFENDFLQRKVTNLDKERWNVASAVDDDEEFIVALEVLNLKTHGDEEQLVF